MPSKGLAKLPQSTCSSSWTPAYAWNPYYNEVELQPFDSTNLRKQEESLLTQCTAAPFSLGHTQEDPTTVDCDMCPAGWSLTPSGLACRGGADICSDKKCKDCQQSMLEWHVTSDCEMCIGDPVCNSDGKCSCDIF